MESSLGLDSSHFYGEFHILCKIACNADMRSKIISTCSIKEWVNFPPLHETGEGELNPSLLF